MWAAGTRTAKCRICVLVVQVADLIARCTSINPQARPTAQRLMEELGQLLRQ